MYWFLHKQVPDIVEYDLHDSVLYWISNLIIDTGKNNQKSIRNCYHSDMDRRYVNRMKNN